MQYVVLSLSNIVIYTLQIAVTQSNRVFVWGCHPFNLRFAAHSMRKARQLGSVVSDPADKYLTPDQVDTSFVNGRINQVCTDFLEFFVLSYFSLA